MLSYCSSKSYPQTQNCDLKTTEPSKVLTGKQQKCAVSPLPKKLIGVFPAALAYAFQSKELFKLNWWRLQCLKTGQITELWIKELTFTTYYLYYCSMQRTHSDQGPILLGATQTHRKTWSLPPKGLQAEDKKKMKSEGKEYNTPLHILGAL